MNMKLDYTFNPPSSEVSRMQELNGESDSTKTKNINIIK